MRAVQSQEYEDEADECVAAEYRLHQFPPEPTGHPFELLDLIGIGIVALVCVLMLLAFGLGIRDEVHFVEQLVR